MNEISVETKIKVLEEFEEKIKKLKGDLAMYRGRAIADALHLYMDDIEVLFNNGIQELKGKPPIWEILLNYIGELRYYYFSLIHRAYNMAKIPEDVQKWTERVKEIEREATLLVEGER